MFDFNRILNWKLLAGSHEFPGSDGGTCINEAAIVAAGFPYRRIGSIADCPPCFSRPLAAYALSLNDGIGDSELRQRLLMPFVTRLAGSADRFEIEQERVKTILLRIVTRLLPQSIESYGRADEALACRSATDLATAADAMHRALDAVCGIVSGNAAFVRKRQDYLEGISGLVSAFVYYNDERRLAEAAAHSASAAIASISLRDWNHARYAERKRDFALAAAFLDEALKIGNRAEPVEADELAARFTRAKQAVPTREPAVV